MYDEQSWKIDIDIRAKHAFFIFLSRLQFCWSRVYIISFTCLRRILEMHINKVMYRDDNIFLQANSAKYCLGLKCMCIVQGTIIIWYGRNQ